MPVQLVDRADGSDVSVPERGCRRTLGQDGLVANTAKYAGAQPIVAVNPDPSRFDGIFLAFLPDQARTAVTRVLERKGAGHEKSRWLRQPSVTVNGYSLSTILSPGHEAMFPRSTGSRAASARKCNPRAASWFHRRRFYRLDFICLQHGFGCGELLRREPLKGVRMPWEDRRLLYVVREPFISRHSQIGIVAGMLEAGEKLVLESLMPSGGAIFRTAWERTFSNSTPERSAMVAAAEQQAHLVVS